MNSGPAEGEPRASWRVNAVTYACGVGNPSPSPSLPGRGTIRCDPCRGAPLGGDPGLQAFIPSGWDRRQGRGDANDGPVQVVDFVGRKPLVNIAPGRKLTGWGRIAVRCVRVGVSGDLDDELLIFAQGMADQAFQSGTCLLIEVSDVSEDGFHVFNSTTATAPGRRRIVTPRHAHADPSRNSGQAEGMARAGGNRRCDPCRGRGFFSLINPRVRRWAATRGYRLSSLRDAVVARSAARGMASSSWPWR
jgi:hypothetical protein